MIENNNFVYGVRINKKKQFPQYKLWYLPRDIQHMNTHFDYSAEKGPRSEWNQSDKISKVDHNSTIKFNLPTLLTKKV